MPMRCFNPSIEGQPLQLGENLEGGNGVYLFQSLYRGTAIATKGYFVNDSLCKNGFQSLYRGTAIATNLGAVLRQDAAAFQSLCRGTAIATG